MDKKLLEPKSVTITDSEGRTKNYTISKLPAIAGRKIISAYPLTAVPKWGDYAANEATMLEMLTYTAVETDSGLVYLSTPELINNHVTDWECLMKLEGQMLEYNVSFFGPTFLQSFMDQLLDRAAPFLSKLLTASLQALSQVDKSLGSNSETN